MAELPEIRVIAAQMDHELAGKALTRVTVTQEKCLDVPQDEFIARLTGQTINQVVGRGKWLRVATSGGESLFICPGMGADFRYWRADEALPEKWQLRLDLSDGSVFTTRFWWFGMLHLAKTALLEAHEPTASLGPDALSEAVTPAWLADMIKRSPRAAIKNLLLDQRRLAGIGNAYAHDILFRARIHPLRTAGSLGPAEVEALHAAMVDVLQGSIDRGGLEPDIYARSNAMGDWQSFMQVGYKEGQPCPACGAPITKIKTGATATFICPECQRL
jgi:formamidopyrimidine-DNA glycosylase